MHAASRWAWLIALQSMGRGWGSSVINAVQHTLPGFVQHVTLMYKAQGQSRGGGVQGVSPHFFCRTCLSKMLSNTVYCVVDLPCFMLERHILFLYVFSQSLQPKGCVVTLRIDKGVYSFIYALHTCMDSPFSGSAPEASTA